MEPAAEVKRDAAPREVGAPAPSDIVVPLPVAERVGSPLRRHVARSPPGAVAGDLDPGAMGLELGASDLVGQVVVGASLGRDLRRPEERAQGERGPHGYGTGTGAPIFDRPSPLPSERSPIACPESALSLTHGPRTAASFFPRADRGATTTDVVARWVPLFGASRAPAPRSAPVVGAETRAVRPLSVGVAANALGGALLVLSGLAYLGLWLALGAPDLAGPTSLRKPILFGLSAGVTLLSMAWVVRHLPPRRGDRLLHVGLAVSLVLEVALIDLQQARGVPSHFNRSTLLDTVIVDVMGALVLFASLVILDAFARAVRGLALPPDRRLAAAWGLGYLVLGCAIGIVITLVGEARAQAGLPPERFGSAGVPKFPHGIPLHALQILPILAWGLERLGVGLGRRVRSVRAAAIAIGLATAYGTVQTVAGAPRFDPVPLGWPLAILTGLAALEVLRAACTGWAAQEPPRRRGF